MNIETLQNNSGSTTFWPSKQQILPQIIQDHQLLDLQFKYNELEAKYKKDKTFYDEALEVRTNQLEELEE